MPTGWLVELFRKQAGDADTNGAVAGALLACKLGLSEIPASWMNGLLHREWFEKHIDR